MSRIQTFVIATVSSIEPYLYKLKYRFHLTFVPPIAPGKPMDSDASA
jgi:hypothetical protein